MTAKMSANICQVAVVLNAKLSLLRGTIISNMINTLVPNEWDVTAGTVWVSRVCPVPSTLYQMQPPTNQGPVYDMHTSSVHHTGHTGTTSFLILTLPQTNSHLLVITLELWKTIEFSACHLEQRFKLLR